MPQEERRTEESREALGSNGEPVVTEHRGEIAAHIRLVVAFGFELVNGFEMHRFAYSRWWTWAALFVVALIGGVTSGAGSLEAQFMSENSAAMAKMMSAMKIRPSGDVDADFVAMMVPHHQGAIDMAQAQLRYGRNEQLRRIAQEIIVTQQEEIAAMRLAIGRPLSSPHHSMDGQP